MLRGVNVADNLDVNEPKDKVILFEGIPKPSQLESEYVNLYGREFVGDLKQAFRWMKADMKMQPSEEKRTIAGCGHRTKRAIGLLSSMLTSATSISSPR